MYKSCDVTQSVSYKGTYPSTSGLRVTQILDLRFSLFSNTILYYSQSYFPYSMWSHLLVVHLDWIRYPVSSGDPSSSKCDSELPTHTRVVPPLLLSQSLPSGHSSFYVFLIPGKSTLFSISNFFLSLFSLQPLSSIHSVFKRSVQF